MNAPQQIIVYTNPLSYYLWNNPQIMGAMVIGIVVAIVVAILVAKLSEWINNSLRHSHIRWRVREDWLTMGSAIITLVLIIFNLGA